MTRLTRSMFCFALAALAPAACGGDAHSDEGRAVGAPDRAAPDADGEPPAGPKLPAAPRGDGACPSLYAQEIVPSFYVEIDPAEWAALAQDYASGVKQYHPLASFRYEGEVAVGAMIRLKGNPQGSWSVPKMQFVISFNEVDKKRRFRGLRKIGLDHADYDRTYLRDRLATDYLRRLGVVASCVNNALLFVNGELYGLYANIEFMDKEYLQRHFGDADEGTLWKWGVEPKANAEAADHDRLAQFHAADTVAKLLALADLDQMIAVWAAEAVVPNLDGFGWGSGNYYLYDHPAHGFLDLPYDFDWTFDINPIAADPFVDHWDPASTGSRPPAVRAVLDDATWRGKYLGAIQAALDAYEEGAQQQKLDAWAAQIAPHAAADPHKSFTTTEHQTAVLALRGYFAQRRAFLKQWLAQQASP